MHLDDELQPQMIGFWEGHGPWPTESRKKCIKINGPTDKPTDNLLRMAKQYIQTCQEYCTKVSNLIMIWKWLDQSKRTDFKEMSLESALPKSRDKL